MLSTVDTNNMDTEILSHVEVVSTDTTTKYLGLLVTNSIFATNSLVVSVKYKTIT